MLSKKAQYAFHALIYLAEHSQDHPVLISEIAQQKNISIKFLENILLELKNAGILGSKKGKGGGYYLLKNPKDIPLARIIRLLDGPIALLPCVSLNYYEKCETCKDEAACGFSLLMSQVRDATLAILENKTVNDILHTGAPPASLPDAPPSYHPQKNSLAKDLLRKTPRSPARSAPRE